LGVMDCRICSPVNKCPATEVAGHRRFKWVKLKRFCKKRRVMLDLSTFR
jgi:hypothetical protein